MGKNCIKKKNKILTIEDQNIEHHYSDYIINSNPKFYNYSNYKKKVKNCVNIF